MGGEVLEKDKRKIADFINEYVNENGDKVILKNKKLMELFAENGVAPESVFYLNSDYCYNTTNSGMIDGFKEDIHLFEHIKRGYYRLLGENYKYTGDVTHKLSKEKEPYIAGHWEDGVLVKWAPRKNK